MNVKKRLIINKVITFLMGAALIAVGCYKSETLKVMGCCMVLITVINSVRLAIICRDGERFKTYETAVNDERNLYIARKSYALTFYLSIWGELAALIVCAYGNLESYTNIFACVICLQVLIYAISRMVYAKKY